MYNLLIPVCKEFFAIPRASDTGFSSPGSCTSGDSLSMSGTHSRKCFSLTCTEVEIGDIVMDEENAPVDVTDKLGCCYEEAARFVIASQQPGASPANISQRIRDDLLKQEQGRTHKLPAASGSPAPCRLPPHHRARIVGWMREVAEALGLDLATLFAATSVMDRFVVASQDLPPDGLLQLMALSCMSVAVKYHEVAQVAPTVWLSLAVDPEGKCLYEPRDLQRFEFSLLQTIGWRLHEPDTHSFLEHYLMCTPQQPAQAAGCSADGGDSATMAVAPSFGSGRYGSDLAGDDVFVSALTARALLLAELSLLYGTSMWYDCSTIALACMALAERMVAGGAEPGGWVRRGPAATAVAAAVVATSGLGLEQLAPGLEACAEALEDSCRPLLLHMNWSAEHY